LARGSSTANLPALYLLPVGRKQAMQKRFGALVR